jgi:hypothetical protein
VVQALHVNGPRRTEPLQLTQPLEGRAEGAGVYPLAMVEWHDAWFDLDQLAIEDRRTDYLVRTVGFLIDEGPGVLSLAQELLPDGEGFRAVTHIPAAVIERVVRIGQLP